MRSLEQIQNDGKRNYSFQLIGLEGQVVHNFGLPAVTPIPGDAAQALTSTIYSMLNDAGVSGLDLYEQNIHGVWRLVGTTSVDKLIGQVR